MFGKIIISNMITSIQCYYTSIFLNEIGAADAIISFPIFLLIVELLRFLSEQNSQFVAFWRFSCPKTNLLTARSPTYSRKKN